MANFITNRGMKLIFNSFFRGDATDTPSGGFKLWLCTSAATPTVDTNVITELTEIANGNGYATGGLTIERSAVGFDVLTEDDSANKAILQMKDAVFTATGGPLPISGDGARWAVLCNTKATPEVLVVFDLTSNQSVSSGQPLTLQDAEIDFEQPAA